MSTNWRIGKSSSPDISDGMFLSTSLLVIVFDFKLSAEFLRKCQVLDSSEIGGTVCPWVLNEGEPPREDLHDTLQAIYVWSRKENQDRSETNLNLALDYVKRRYEWYRSQPEPMKSYDSSFLLLALNMYLKRHFDNVLDEIRAYALDYLTNFFRSGPFHNAREYSNPYWKAAILHSILTDSGLDGDFLMNWLNQDGTLVNPDLEEFHKGRGYMFPHDFFSTFGTKLFAINLIIPDFPVEVIENAIPVGYVNRKLDEVSFNSSILFGLCTFRNSGRSTNPLKLNSTIDNIFAKLEGGFIDGGTKRGPYRKIRESWPTFFVYFAQLMRNQEALF